MRTRETQTEALAGVPQRTDVEQHPADGGQEECGDDADPVVARQLCNLCGGVSLQEQRAPSVV